MLKINSIKARLNLASVSVIVLVWLMVLMSFTIVSTIVEKHEREGHLQWLLDAIEGHFVETLEETEVFDTETLDTGTVETQGAELENLIHLDYQEFVADLELDRDTGLLIWYNEHLVAFKSALSPFSEKDFKQIQAPNTHSFDNAFVLNSVQVVADEGELDR